MNVNSKIIVFSRRLKVLIQVFVDFFILVFSALVAFFLWNGSFELTFGKEFLFITFITGIVCIISLSCLNVYNALIRFITGKVLVGIAIASFITAIVFGVLNFVLEAGIPLTVQINFALLFFICASSVRFFARRLLLKPKRGNKKPVIIYGAGNAGLQLINALLHGDEYKPVALVDDDLDLQTHVVAGFLVQSPSSVVDIAHKLNVTSIFLAIPDNELGKKAQAIESMKDKGLQIKSIPSMEEIVHGKAEISDLRTIQIEELLSRETIPPDPNLLRENILNCDVLVSGAGGSIGSELCRQILAEKPKSIILLEIAEASLYSIELELNIMIEKEGLSSKVIPVLGSVQNKNLIESIFKHYTVNTVFHAAAYKHVPLVESNIIEGVLNNAFGTFSIASAAAKYNVQRFILVSTDKAVRPTNVMGATKRLAEIVCQVFNEQSPETIFSIVRFGNVLGSSGSVIPLFEAQISSGGPVTVTHEKVNRYFMTISEAVQLVIQAGAIAEGGEVFILDMGKPVKILDLAISMIRLKNYRPYSKASNNLSLPVEGDMEIKIIGLRKGEKLFEELFIDNNPSSTRHPRIMVAKESFLTIATLTEKLNKLNIACCDLDIQRVKKILKDFELGYTVDDSTL